jgi:hypothetical protein
MGKQTVVAPEVELTVGAPVSMLVPGGALVAATASSVIVSGVAEMTQVPEEAKIESSPLVFGGNYFRVPFPDTSGLLHLLGDKLPVQSLDSFVAVRFIPVVGFYPRITIFMQLDHPEGSVTGGIEITVTSVFGDPGILLERTYVGLSGVSVFYGNHPPGAALVKFLDEYAVPFFDDSMQIEVPKSKYEYEFSGHP